MDLSKITEKISEWDRTASKESGNTFTNKMIDKLPKYAKGTAYKANEFVKNNQALLFSGLLYLTFNSNIYLGVKVGVVVTSLALILKASTDLKLGEDKVHLAPSDITLIATALTIVGYVVRLPFIQGASLGVLFAQAAQKAEI